MKSHLKRDHRHADAKKENNRSIPLFGKALTAMNDLKVWLFGEDLWSGPGKVTGTGEPSAIEDVSFLHEGGEEAVLLIHGLTGTPTEMRFIGKALANAGYTVMGMQLAGHCGTEHDLLLTEWQDWYASVEAAYLRLAKRHSTIYVAGLSMGAVLALRLAAHHPVKAVALYSLTFWYDGWSTPRLRWLLPLFLLTPFGERYRFIETFPYGIKDDRLRARVVANMMSGQSAAAGTLGMTGASLRQMHRLSAEVRRHLRRIHTPTLVLHSTNDDVASLSNVKFLERKLRAPVHKVLLDDCYHIITVDRQRNKVAEETIRFFRRHSEATPARPDGNVPAPIRQSAPECHPA